MFAILKESGFGIYKADGGELTEIGDGYHSPECENLLAIRDVDDFRLRLS